MTEQKELKLGEMPDVRTGDVKPCKICGKGVMHTGVPLCFEFSIRRVGIEKRKVDQNAGLEQMLGSVPLARIMGDDRIGKYMSERNRVWVCLNCVNENPVLYTLEDQ